MKMIQFITFLSIILISLASSCEKAKHNEDELITVNNSNHNILVLITFNYPDTTLQDNGGCIDCNVLIEPNTTYQHFYFPNNKYGWKSHISDRNAQNVLSMFVIHGDTLTKYSFEEVKADYNILKRYDLSISDLEKQNWTVTYP